MRACKTRSKVAQVFVIIFFHLSYIDLDGSAVLTFASASVAGRILVSPC